MIVIQVIPQELNCSAVSYWTFILLPHFILL